MHKFKNSLLPSLEERCFSLIERFLHHSKNYHRLKEACTTEPHKAIMQSIAEARNLRSLATLLRKHNEDITKTPCPAQYLSIAMITFISIFGIKNSFKKHLIQLEQELSAYIEKHNPELAHEENLSLGNV